MKLGHTFLSSLNPVRTTPNNQRQGALKLDANIEHSSLGHFADSVHSKEVMIRDGLVNLMETIKAQLQEHSKDTHQIRNTLIHKEEISPSNFFSNQDNDNTSTNDILLAHLRKDPDQPDLASEFAKYTQAPVSKGIRILSDNGLFDDETVALWLHPRSEKLPPGLNIHTDILDEKGNPNLPLEKQIVARTLQHFHDEELLSKQNISSMVIYEMDEKGNAGQSHKPVFTKNTISLEPHTLDLSA